MRMEHTARTGLFKSGWDLLSRTGWMLVVTPYEPPYGLPDTVVQ